MAEPSNGWDVNFAGTIAVLHSLVVYYEFVLDGML